MAGREYIKPHLEVPEPFNALTPEQYRDIRFRPEATIWRGENLDYEIKLLPLGWLYDIPVDLWIVDGDKARSSRPTALSSRSAHRSKKALRKRPTASRASAFKGRINRADSLRRLSSPSRARATSRSLGRGQQYGLSARGLAINTARAGGEEFPIFRAFWIERPAAGSTEIVVHALLDSVSATGAYRFVIRPGQTTEMDVDVVLFPRRELHHVGFAPLTSMFLHGSANQRVDHDYRPSVHNSEGLAVWNGMGERLWRPLTNPEDASDQRLRRQGPQGLRSLPAQSRSFSTYEDLEARFDRRPTAWVEPKGGWGDGYIELIEIPVTEEIHDNIVAYWKPATSSRGGQGPPLRLQALLGSRRAGRVDRGQGHQDPGRRQRVGRYNSLRRSTSTGLRSPSCASFPAQISPSSHGKIANLLVQRHPEIQGLRVRFELQNGGTEVIELRLGLKLAGQLISESWLYRWTKP